MSYQYSVTKGKHCGGTSIKEWNDGMNSNYRRVDDLDECIGICNLHAECDAFVYRLRDGICGMWKKGPLYLNTKSGHDCHKKTKILQGISLEQLYD